MVLWHHTWMSEDQREADEDVVQSEQVRGEVAPTRDDAGRDVNGLHTQYCINFATVTQVAAGAGLATFLRGYIEALAARSGDVTFDWLKKPHIRTTSKGKSDVEVRINGAITTFEVADDMPDEARLALIDLDLTSEQWRGHRLKWDGKAWVRNDPPE